MCSEICTYVYYIITDHPKNCTNESSISPLDQREVENFERFTCLYTVQIYIGAKPFDMYIACVQFFTLDVIIQKAF